MAEYQWRDGFPAKIEADVFGREVERIAAEKGKVRPQDIVEAAKQVGSPIGAALEWDNAKAAAAHRLDQARSLLGALQVVRVKVEHGPVVASKALYRVRDHGERPGYVPRDQILGDRELRKQVIGSAQRELNSFVAKYREVLAMGSYVPRLQEVLDEMLDEIERLGVDATARRSPSRPRHAAGSIQAAAE